MIARLAPAAMPRDTAAMLARLTIFVLVALPVAALADVSGIKNAVIDLPSYQRIADQHSIQMTQGAWKWDYPGSPEVYTVRLDPEWTVFADLDGNGVQEAAAIITQGSSHGTGHFVGLMVFEQREGGWRSVTETSLGDRVIVRSVSVRHGVVTVDLTAHGPRDGLCCPTQDETWQFEFSREPRPRLVRR